MIAAALLLAAFAPGQDAVGPFVIESKVEREQGFPYPIDRKRTSLQWKAPSGLASYLLSDDGDAVVLTYQVGEPPRHCLGRAGPLRLADQAAARFGKDDLLACNVLDAAQSRVLGGEVRTARPFFAAAYARFRTTTLAQHGPHLQRCRETTMGNHGPICMTFWDEGRSAPDPQTGGVR
ncbi:MAG: hypothetical protein EOP58_14480 [Sphingomonadales bacterium]|nr:MAG: hypothetical protein EOP58_14480 [Sphingomonadales bacterium]